MLKKRQIKNSIEFTTDNGYIIIKTNKEDLKFINDKYGLTNNQATYLVIGDSISNSIKEINYYVGESCTNVISRLNESINRRSWIKEIFIIISTQGCLTMEIVKSLEFMIVQCLNNCLLSNSESTIINCDNASTGVIGYRAKFGNNEYTLLIEDIFKVFFFDVFLYSKYKTYFNDFESNVLINKGSKICFNKSDGELYSCINIGDNISVSKNSRITIELDTLSNSSDGVKTLFRSLLQTKAIYPVIFNNNVQWNLVDSIILPRFNGDNLVILCTNSLNSTLNNSTLEVSSYFKRYTK